MRRKNDFIPRTQARGPPGHRQTVGGISDADGMPDIQVGSQLALKIRQILLLNECATPNDSAYQLDELIFLFRESGPVVEEWDLFQRMCGCRSHEVQ
jgi:hypothetical protein